MASEEKSINIHYKEISSISKLSEMDKRAMDMAISAADRAYAPYSNFKVGAAIVMEGGLIITGSNQENAAYPSGLCAERVAVFSAASEYPNRLIEKIIVVAKSKNGEIVPVSPCGSCRQALLEYEDKQSMPIIVTITYNNGSLIEFSSINSLLPFGFNRDQIK